MVSGLALGTSVRQNSEPGLFILNSDMQGPEAALFRGPGAFGDEKRSLSNSDNTEGTIKLKPFGILKLRTGFDEYFRRAVTSEPP